MTRPPLLRTADDRLLAGVCGGLAQHLGAPVSAVRGIMLALTLLGGAGALLYLWLWAMVPQADGIDPLVPMRRALTRPAAGAARAGGCETPSALQGDGGGPGTRHPGDRARVAGGGTEPRPGTVTGPGPGPGGRRDAGASPVVAVERAPEQTPMLEARTTEAAQQPSAAQELPVTELQPGASALAAAPALPGAPAQPAGAPTAASAPAGSASAADPTVASAPRKQRWPIAELLLGTCLLIAGLGLVLVRFGVEINLALVLPALAVLVGVGLTWWQIADRDHPHRNQVPRVLGALALVAAGMLLFFVTAREPSAWTVITAAFAVLAGVALAIAPWLLRLNRELIAERAARARESERSDIAAHLHDSVLQTLALIQQRSDPGSEVSRIARGQERELREWLFRAADGIPRPPREAVGEELRAHAAMLEEGHPVRFEIVEVGTLGEVPEPILAAAREAMLNAARHAGGDVTVYLEATDARIAIDVTDRGPGLDLAQLPVGRMGVRDSILGRMERAGGSARIVPGPGGGTSVRLGIQRPDPAHPGSPSEKESTHE